MHRHGLQQARQVGVRQVVKASEPTQVNATGLHVEQRAQGLGRGLGFERVQRRDACRLAPAPRQRESVEHLATAQRALCRLVANDEAIAAQRTDRLVEQQLGERVVAAMERLVAQQGDATGDVLGPKVHMHGSPVAQRFDFGGRQRQPHIQPVGGRMQRLAEQPLAARDVALVELRCDDVDGAALADAARVRRTVLRVQAPHAHLDAQRRNHQPITNRNAPCKHRARDHGANARQRERAIDRQAKVPAAARVWRRR